MTQPFSLQDTVMQARFREIVRDHKIKVIVETGIDKGLSTVVLAGMVDLVLAIDNNLDCFGPAYSNLGNADVGNAVLLCGSSPHVLHAMEKILPDETLFFLDAHWYEYWPLLDEINVIRRESGVIVIHDFFVPGHPELEGCNFIGGTQPLDYEYVRDALTRWSPRHRIEYNSRADCPLPRGVLYAFPE